MKDLNEKTVINKSNKKGAVNIIVMVVVLAVVAIGFLGIKNFKSAFGSDHDLIKEATGKTFKKVFGEKNEVANQMELLDEIFENLKELEISVDEIPGTGIGNAKFIYQEDSKNSIGRIFGELSGESVFELFLSDSKGVISIDDTSYNFSPATLGKDYNKWAIDNNIAENSSMLPIEIDETIDLSFNSIIDVKNEYIDSIDTDTGHLSDLMEKAEILKTKQEIQVNGKTVKADRYTITISENDINEYMSDMGEILNSSSVSDDIDLEVPSISGNITSVVDVYKKNVAYMEIGFSKNEDLKIYMRLKDATDPSKGMEIRMNEPTLGEIGIDIENTATDKNVMTLQIVVMLGNNPLGRVRINVDLNKKSDNLTISVGDLGDYLGVEGGEISGDIVLSKTECDIQFKKLSISAMGQKQDLDFAVKARVSSNSPKLTIPKTSGELFDLDYMEMEDFIGYGLY